MLNKYILNILLFLIMPLIFIEYTNYRSYKIIFFITVVQPMKQSLDKNTLFVILGPIELKNRIKTIAPVIST